jgi:hypothetical protein
MRRPVLLALPLALILGLSLVIAPPAGTLAQDAATPAAASVTFQPVTGSDVAPATRQAGVDLAWARFAPGASYVIPEEDASLLLVAVESGTLSVTSSAPVVVNRAPAGTPAAGETSGTVSAGDEVTLAAGDSFVRSPGSTQTLRNDGMTEAVALTASIGAPSLQRAGAPESAGLVVAVAVVAVPQCPAGYIPAEIEPAATPGGGGGGGGAGGVAVAIAAAPECVGGATAATPTP